MIAAIYARKSTEQRGALDSLKAVNIQIEEATKFAYLKGWAVDGRFIFKDDGVSGTEFERRPGLQQLLEAVRRGAPFQTLIVSEQKSLGREIAETAYLVKKLAQAGVEIFEYEHGQSLTPRTPTDKLVFAAQGLADEDHGVKTGERTKRGHTKRVLEGYCVGGRVFGYENVKVYPPGADPYTSSHTHVLRKIVPDEAVVVRRIFQLYADGYGAKSIAKRLNQEDTRAPKPYVPRDPKKVKPVAHWCPPTIRTILCRELYRGVVVWNRSSKRDKFRQRNPQPRPEAEWVRLRVNDDLRIVSDELWKRVQSRRADTAGKTLRFSDGRMSGRPPKTEAKNLLAGLAMCAVCGGALIVETSPRKRGRIKEYSATASGITAPAQTHSKCPPRNSTKPFCKALNPMYSQKRPLSW